MMITRTLVCVLVLLTLTPATFGQRKRPPTTPPKPVIFAVLNDGGWLEPIAYIEKGKLEPAVDGASEPEVLQAFHRTYYRPKTSFRLIFGGADAGTAVVKGSDPAEECSKNLADISVVSKRAKLKGMVRALATNARSVKPGSGVRRLPTPAERREIEALVRAQFSKQKISEEARTSLKYHNLTAIDIDNDGTAEMVGSFWVEPAKTERALLFFIAEKGNGKNYHLAHSEFDNVKTEDTMSKDISDVDRGVYHELLLDSFDFDGDGSSEIFTYVQSFEGGGFNAYSRKGGKWSRIFEGSNYSCGY